MARAHDGMSGVVVLAVVLRLLIEHRSIPGVTQDSLIYTRLAPHAPFAPFSPTRPSGYPLVMRLIDILPGSQLDAVTASQHAAGVAIGVLVYLVALRTGVRPWLAAAAAAVPLFDSYTIALEQSILAETFFSLAIVAAAYVVLHAGGVWSAAASGLLLGLACTMRSVGVLVVAVWVAWLVLTRVGYRTVLIGLAGALLPVVAYATMHAVQGAGFQLVGSDGWYLYAKVGPIVDCSGADIPEEAASLCVPPTSTSFEFYLYAGASPAYRLFHGGRTVDLEQAITPENNRLLRQFSLAVIKAHPVSFARAVGKDFLRYLGPGNAQGELSLYGKPGTLVALYERLHVVWWMISGPLVAGAAVIAFGRRAREVALLVGMSVALILGASATSGFNIRYLLPALPLLAATGAMAVEEALSWWRSLADRAPKAN